MYTHHTIEFRLTYAFQLLAAMHNAESVRQFQPGVALWQPRGNFQGCANLLPTTMTQGFRANTPTPCGLPARGPRPGLKLANAFSVIIPKLAH